MSLRENLQIVLITYNRSAHVQNTLRYFMADNSPVRDYDFVVLDNNSSDDTALIVKNWQKKFPNISYQKNRYNLGISGNIFRAMEIADKDYVWIIGDDDKYDFSNWAEVESAIKNNEKIICLARYAIPDKNKNDPAYQLFQLTFITGGIYSTSLFNDTVMRNAIDNVYTLFPHIAPVVQYLNEGGQIYVTDKAISDNGMDASTTDVSYTRGARSEQLYMRSRTMSWIVGYCNILSQMADIEIKKHAINVAILYKDIEGSFENFYNHMSSYVSHKQFMHFIDVYINVGPEQAEKLREIYYKNVVKGNVCDLINTKYCLKYLIQRIKYCLLHVERTYDWRYLIICGVIKIKTRRKHKNKIRVI